MTNDARRRTLPSNNAFEPPSPIVAMAHIATRTLNSVVNRVIELNSPSIESLLTSKVLQRLPFIPNALRLKSGSSSRKEEDPVAEKIDRPVLVMTVSIQSKNNISTRSAIWRV
jgi:hypothetical protein